MDRAELDRLSKEELVELVLKLQRPAKTSRTSSKPPSADRKTRREQARPGGAKPGHKGHCRALHEDPKCPGSTPTLVTILISTISLEAKIISDLSSPLLLLDSTYLLTVFIFPIGPFELLIFTAKYFGTCG